jgi:ATP-dependent DNA helicase PIF1
MEHLYDLSAEKNDSDKKRIITTSGALSIKNFMNKIPQNKESTTKSITITDVKEYEPHNEAQDTGVDTGVDTGPDTTSDSDTETRIINNTCISSNLEMSPEQELAFTKYKLGENVFITGPGGTGKSALIREIYGYAQQKGHNIQVCALTGCAAIMLGCKAKTIHSWAGVGLANGDIDKIVERVNKNFFKKKEWRKTRTLIIDEVSMMSKRLFEILDMVGRTVRNCASKPFGGIQLIFCGDFYQLPPVGINTEDPDNSKFCFESERWFTTFSKTNHIQLKRIFRQNDPIYCEVLNQVREGRIKRKTDEILRSRVGVVLPEFASDGTPQTKPTILYPTRSRVDEINREEMEKLSLHNEESRETYTYKLKYVTDIPITEKERQHRESQTPDRIKMELDMLKNSILCDENVQLKVGAQVMCIINMEESVTTANTPICNGSQGIIIRMTEMNPRLPVVRFNNGLEMTINYHTWLSDNIPGIGVSQLPLILSWAITIHKSQGASLERCIIDIGDAVFESGQSYVALSRIISLEGVSIKSYDVRKIYVNKKVREFYETLK